MTEIKEKKNLPQLVKVSTTYKLIVPSNVEEKIRYLLRKFPSTEWSGVLFYTHEGSFENNDLVITCQDIYPMDLGNATYTDFNMNEDVAAYMADNIELFDCDLGLIHSHHTMSAFFSGTDTQTLREEGNERNCFVSLIVNNEGKYCAAVTRKVQYKSEVTTTSLGKSYQFFGQGEVSQDKDPMSEHTEIIDQEIIEYFMLDVERHTAENPLEYLDARFDEIQKKKDEAKRVPVNSVYPSNNYYKDYSWINSSNYGNDYDWDWDDWPNKSLSLNKPKVEEPTLWDKDTMNNMKVKDTKEYVPDKNLIHTAVCKMITCSLNLQVEKFSLKQWIVKHMKHAYDKIFNPENSIETKFSPFQTWVEFIVDFMVTNFDDPKAPLSLDVYQMESMVAEAMIDELTQYQADCVYIQDYIDGLSNYIV